MSGHNGRDKYLTTNREDEVLSPKTRGVEIKNVDSIVEITDNSPLTIDCIMKGMVIQTPGLIQLDWPVGYTAKMFLNDLRKYGQIELWTVIADIPIINIGNPVGLAISLPPGCHEAITNNVLLNIPLNSYNRLEIRVIQLEDTPLILAPVFEAVLY